MKNPSTLILSGALAALLSACGGGGDSAPLAGGTQVAITSANQTTVARSTVAGGFSVARTAVGGTDDRTHAQSVGGSHVSSGAGALDRVLRESLARLSDGRRGTASAGTHVASVSNNSGTCSLGGTYNIAFDDRDNNSTTSSGDVITFTYSHCAESDSSIDGTLVVTLGSGTTTTVLAGTVAYQGMTLSSGASSVALNGSASISEVDSNGVYTDTFTVGSSGLSVAASSTGYSDTITYASGMTIVEVSSDASSATSVRIDGTFSSNTLGGRVTVATVTPIVDDGSADYPVSGQLRVTGASGSVLRLTVASATQVQLELDADGNGVYEGNTLVDWATLLPF